MKSQNDILEQFRRSNSLFDEYYFMHGKSDPQRNSKFPKGFHTSVDLWLAGVEGLLRTLEWSLGRAIFYESFYLLTEEYLRKLRLPGWADYWAFLPHGDPLPFQFQKLADYQLLTDESIRQLAARAVAVQNRVLTIEKMHPGKWSPMYHGRVKKWLVNVENIIRASDWILEKRSLDETFYLLSSDTLDQLDRARRTGLLTVGMIGGGQAQVDRLVGMPIGAEDHKPEDFR